jgi:ATP-dependent DNA helicase RecQ
VLALTATATSTVREDIVGRLSMNDPDNVRAGFDRPNLRFMVMSASSRQKKDALLVRIVRGIFLQDSSESGSVIIYCARKRDTERLASLLTALCQVPIRPYHAGMDRELRAHVQDAFMREVGGLRVVAATKAFGMGIDKEDVRYVIHYDMPGSVEDYYQEAGRAGRDGKASWCVLLHGRRDRSIHEYFIEQGVPELSEMRQLFARIQTASRGNDGIALLSVQRLAEELDTTETSLKTQLHWLEEAGTIRRAERDVTARGRLKLFVPATDAVGALEEPLRADAKRVFDALELRGADEALIDALRLQRRLGIDPSRLQEILTGIETATDGEMENGYPIGAYQSWDTAAAIEVLEGGADADLSSISQTIDQLRRVAEERLAAMERYIQIRGCRRQFILEHFEDPGAAAVAPCGRCDRCVGDLGVPWSTTLPLDVPDVTLDGSTTRTILDAVAWADGHCAEGHLVRMLHGTRTYFAGGSTREIPRWLVESDYFGKLLHVPEPRIRDSVTTLLADQCLSRESRQGGSPTTQWTYGVLRLTAEGAQRRAGRATRRDLQRAPSAIGPSTVADLRVSL